MILLLSLENRAQGHILIEPHKEGPSQFRHWHAFCFCRVRRARRLWRVRFAENDAAVGRDPFGGIMLYWAAVFFVIALLAAIFGFGGIAASAAGVAKILFFVFLILALLSFIFGRRVPT